MLGYYKIMRIICISIAIFRVKNHGEEEMILWIKMEESMYGNPGTSLEKSPTPLSVVFIGCRAHPDLKMASYMSLFQQLLCFLSFFYMLPHLFIVRV